VLLLAIALILTWLLVTTLAGRPVRVRVGGAAPGEQSVRVRRGARLQLLNADLRPHQLWQAGGPPLDLDGARLDRAGSSLAIRFARPGAYTLHTFAGPCFLPHLEHDVRRTHATLHVRVR
jgi:hypothetical protein